MVLWDGLINGLQGVWTVARVVIPLMIFLEIARENHWLDHLTGSVQSLFRHIGLSNDGAFSALVATIFGLTFGSGVILANIKEGTITQDEAKILGGFIAINHALIEDTLLFVFLGVPTWILVVPRLFVAIAVSFVTYRIVLWQHGQIANYERKEPL